MGYGFFSVTDFALFPGFPNEPKWLNRNRDIRPVSTQENRTGAFLEKSFFSHPYT